MAPIHGFARALIAGGLAIALASCEASDAERGRRLFAGELPLLARIAGHDAALPSHASRCVNCHGVADGAAGAASAPSFGTPLSRARLVNPQPRRGGPPSRFDEASLCRLLRSGVDPAHVMVPSAMPRYEIDDADCRALWAHLSREAT